MASLSYYEGAVPGKKRKKSKEERDVKKKEYEQSRVSRSFSDKWKIGRDWLSYDKDSSSMSCSICKDFYSDDSCQKGNTFISGCRNFRYSAVTDHESSNAHRKAQCWGEGRKKTAIDKMHTQAGKVLQTLRASERSRLQYLFRNVHAIAKNNRPLTDYSWLCDLDQAKSLEIGTTYKNSKAAAEFIRCIAMTEIKQTIGFITASPYFSFMMDGSTDISGDEQEAMYIRSASSGVITERFLNIGSPKSTKSEDLYEHVMAVFKDYNIDTDKLVAMGSDGASNMTGVRSGLSTLLRDRVSGQLVNVHCLSHRLELAFRDVVKKIKLYDKLMTLLIGLYYFYKKSYKNKQGLQTSIEAIGRGVYPTKVTGTRWLPHLYRGIGAFLKTYNALEAHLSTVSHDNAKGEGLLKLMMDKQLMAFIIFLQDALEPAIRLSLKLQKPEVTLADSLCWVDSTIELLLEKKEKTCEALDQLLVSGKYCDIVLKGNTPTMKYGDELLQGFCEAIRERFQTESRNVLNATKILNLGCWPESDLADFGNEEVKRVYQHYQKKLTHVIPSMSAESVANEWNLLKKLVMKKCEITNVTWGAIFRAIGDLPQIRLLVDLMLTIPSTSVSCETTFSQLKLLKTCRRSRLGSALLNDLMTVKLVSPEIVAFHPDKAIDTWLAESIKGRKPNYKRSSAEIPTSDREEATDEVVLLSDSEDEGFVTTEETVSEGRYVSVEVDINSLCDKNEDFDADDECFDYQDEIVNFERLMLYSRE